MAGRVKIPTGDKITIEHGKLRVPDNPIIAFIEGDGAGQDTVNPGSVILSGEMMFRYIGWNEAADRIVAGLETTIGQKVVTYDFARLTEGAKEVKCSEFGTAIIANMKKL